VRKALLILFYFAVTFFSTVSYSQTANVIEGCVPLEVKFTAPVTSSTYYWDFKDGVFSSLANPTNIFNKPGTYQVTFQETAGSPVIGSIQIKVYAEPNINIKATSGCAPLNSQFQDISVIDPAIPITNYVWVFGDGQNSQGVKDASHIYSAVGLYDVSYNIQTAFPTCNKTVIFKKAVEVITPPTAQFSTNPANTITCNNNINITYTSSSSGVKPMTYAWNFGNGSTSALQTPPLQSYNKGQYNASLMASYTGMTGCTSMFTKPVSAGRPTVNLTYEKDTVCINSPTWFKTTSLGNYKWNFGTGYTNLNNPNSDSVSVLFTTPGYHQVALTVTSPNGQCSDTKIARVYVDRVTAQIVSDPTFTCQSPATINYKAISNQSTVKYLWIFEDRKIDSIPNVTKTFKSATDTLYYGLNIYEPINTLLTVTSLLTGCSAIATKTDTLWIPNALFSPSVTQGCFPLPVTMSDSSTSFKGNKIVKWEWIFGDGTKQVNFNRNNVIHNYTSPGEYFPRLIVTTEKGCIDTSFAILIQVGKKLTTEIDFSITKTNVCLGDLFGLTALPTLHADTLIDAYHFGAESGRLSHCADQKSTNASFNHEVGSQNISLTVEYNGCMSTITKNGLITVNGAIAKIDYTALCSNPYQYNFKDASVNATSIEWSFGDGGTATTSAETHNYLASGDYNVTLKAINNTSSCPATIDHKKVYVRKVKSKIIADSLICISDQLQNPYTFDASESEDVDASCHKGYSWQFPNLDKRPHTSAYSSTDFIFTKPGTYILRLVTSDVNGCTDTASSWFKVYDMAVNFSVTDSSVCIPSMVQFKDLTVADTTIAGWQWNFGDENLSFLKNPTHSYTTEIASQYMVNLTISDKLGCHEFYKLPINYYKPVSNILISDPTLCLGDTVIVEATDFTSEGSKLSFTWNFGNGETSIIKSNKVVYKASQTFPISLAYEEVSSGCKDVITSSVAVQAYPVADITTNVDDLQVLCAPQNVFFKDASVSNDPLSHHWNFGNGQSSQAKDFSLFYAKGFYKAEHIVATSFGCRDTSKQEFNVFSPEGDFKMNRNSICKGDEITFTLIDTADVDSYTWAFGDGNVLDDESPTTHAYLFRPPTGIVPARLVIRGFDGICPVEVQKSVNILQVISDFKREDGIDTSICFNENPYEFTNTSNMYDNYLWKFGDGTTSSTQLHPTHNYATSGIYSVTLYVNNNTHNCKDSITKEVVIYPNPVVIAKGDSVCQGELLNLQVINPKATSSYLWTPSTGLSNTIISNPTSSVTSSIQYQVEETDKNGCKDVTSVPAVVLTPIPLNDFDTTIIIGDQISLPVFGKSTYIFQWNPEEGLSCLQCEYPLVRPLEDALYELTVTDPYGCFTSEFDFNIHVKPNTFVKLPTTFTPNGDGNNDVIYVKGWGIKNLKEFTIYNRWGQLIYTSTNIDEGWDGTFKGALQNSDVYAYKVKVLSWKDEEISDEGFINLLR
jgi:gliding motility-associated-like protein